MLLLKNRPELYCSLPVGIIAEVGVHYGDNAEDILNFGSPKKLFLIDCWEPQTGEYEKDPANKQLDNAYEGVIKRFAPDPEVTILKMYSLDAAKAFSDGYFDWVYLDGDHTFKAVLADLAAWWPKVKVGGFLCGHDYIDPKYNKTYSYIQVKEALEVFGKPLYALTDEKYGSWAIKKEEEL